MRRLAFVLVPMTFVACGGAPSSSEPPGEAPADAGVDHGSSGIVRNPPRVSTPAGPWGDCTPMELVPKTARVDEWMPPKYQSYEQSIAVLRDGRVMVGGARAIWDPHADVYEMIEDWWKKSGIERPWGGASTTLLDDGHTVLVMGGDTIDGTYGSRNAYLVDLTTKTVRATGKTKAPRGAHRDLKLRNGKVLVYGGYEDFSEDGVPTPNLEVFDPATETWSTPEGMPETFASQRNVDAVELADGRVHVNDGLDYVYEPSTHTIRRALGALGYLRDWSVRLDDGRILASGWSGDAVCGSSSGPICISVMDPSSETWNRIGQVRNQLSAGGTTIKPILLPCGRILLLEGKYRHLLDPNTLDSSDALPGSTTVVDAESRWTWLPTGEIFVGNVNFSFGIKDDDVHPALLAPRVK
jgi:hypothetical protein